MYGLLKTATVEPHVPENAKKRAREVELTVDLPLWRFLT
jgi:hypothetical protein